MAEVAKVSHPLPSGINFHDAAETPLLNHNRHATCVDCHNAHASNPELQFSAPPAMRPPQAGRTGISALDGITPLIPAVNQYETCLRCHGTSTGKQRLIVYGYAADARRVGARSAEPDSASSLRRQPRAIP